MTPEEPGLRRPAESRPEVRRRRTGRDRDAGPARGAQRADPGHVARARRDRRRAARRRTRRGGRRRGPLVLRGSGPRGCSTPAASTARWPSPDLAGLDVEAFSEAVDELPAGLHLAARPAHRLGGGRAGLCDRRGLPAGAGLRPAGARRRRPAQHEGDLARARPGPHGNKAAGRGGWLLQSTGDLHDGSPGRCGRRRLGSGWPRRWSREATWRPRSPIWSRRCSTAPAGAVRDTKALLLGAVDRTLEEQRVAEREAQHAEVPRAGRAEERTGGPGCR